MPIRPLGKLLQQMARDGYQGAVSIEADPSTLAVEDREKCLAGLRRALDFCRTHFA